MEWLNFRHLYAFWSVCRHGGFRKASERIFVSQSTVSEQVASLEDYLGESLIDRNTRTFSVTERGAALLQYADAIFAKSQAINSVFRDKHDDDAPPRLRLGMVGGISRNFVYGLIAAHTGRDSDDNAASRRMQFDVVDGSLDELHSLLRSFDLDVVFSLERPRQQDLMSFRHRQVTSSPICVAGTPSLVKEARRARRRKEPSTTPELFLFRHAVDGATLEERVHQQLHTIAPVSVSTDDISLLRFLANSGRGLAVVPEVGIREDLVAGHVHRIELDDAPQIEVFASYLDKGVRRPVIEHFLDEDT